MGDVVELGCATTLPIPPERILDAAKGVQLTEVVVLGFTEQGEFYIASSDGYLPDLLWLVEKARQRILAQPEE